MFYTIKDYGHNLGLSCAFRQWRAESHCRFLHGYSVRVKLVFKCEELDIRNWGVDFGSLKSLKGWFENTFDHKTIVAMDDPELKWFEEAEKRGILEIMLVPHTGMEQFSKMIFEATEVWLKDNGYSPRVKIHAVEVYEHDANGAIYTQ